MPKPCFGRTLVLALDEGQGCLPFGLSRHTKLATASPGSSLASAIGICYSPYTVALIRLTQFGMQRAVP